MEFSTIHFKDLSNYNDSNSLVFVAMTLKENELPDVVDFLKRTQLVPEGKNLTGAYRILDNVLGNKGRTDWLFTFDREDLQFAPLVRLRMADWVKWTSDFIDNYKEDFEE